MRMIDDRHPFWVLVGIHALLLGLATAFAAGRLAPYLRYHRRSRPLPECFRFNRTVISKDAGAESDRSNANRAAI